MKYIILFLLPISINAETFKYKNGLTLSASSYKLASRECFKRLTGGKYLGEEAGLNIIDICVNPIKGMIK